MEDGAAASDAAELFETLMGADVARRREYLIANSTLLDPATLDV
jgi:DNA gyrase subunit B